MIVVDTNIIAYLYLPTEYTKSAEELLIKEPVWSAPSLWRSEFRNVLTLYLRKDVITLEQAIQIQTEAESLMDGNEFEINSIDILKIVTNSSCSAYDCEFVSLAKSLETTLVTADKKIISEFPDVATSIRLFLNKT
ncbi:MAG: PIN domain-containing protein [Desulfobacteraceae bacterium]|nr:MAG: PIN domain-containing protein [Desulfobacteraceae bacterium]